MDGRALFRFWTVVYGIIKKLYYSLVERWILTGGVKESVDAISEWDRRLSWLRRLGIFRDGLVFSSAVLTIRCLTRVDVFRAQELEELLDELSCLLYDPSGVIAGVPFAENTSSSIIGVIWGDSNLIFLPSGVTSNLLNCASSSDIAEGCKGVDQDSCMGAVLEDDWIPGETILWLFAKGSSKAALVLGQETASNPSSTKHSPNDKSKRRHTGWPELLMLLILERNDVGDGSVPLVSLVYRHTRLLVHGIE